MEGGDKGNSRCMNLVWIPQVLLAEIYEFVVTVISVTVILQRVISVASHPVSPVSRHPPSVTRLPVN